jgi:hypothetical protein
MGSATKRASKPLDGEASVANDHLGYHASAE